MANIPAAHIEDAHQLTADGEIFLYELTPTVGGTIYFKADNPVTWRGNTYEGVPLNFSGESRSSETGSSRPTLVIGDTNIDLGALKPLLFDGYVDGAMLIRRRILRAQIEGNIPGSEDHYYKVRHPSDYGRSSISLELARAADSLDFSFPFHQYYAPDFPAVIL